MKKYDDKTLKIIKQLAAKKKNKKLTKIDEFQLEKLINKEVDYNQIQEERKKCKNDPKYFINTYIYVKNKLNPENIPKHLKDKILDDKIKFELQPIQEELLNAILNHNKIISVKSRQIGFTTTTIAAALQFATYNNNKTILIFSKSQEYAIKTLEELKFMQENLPFFLRRKALENNKKTLKLGDKYTATTIESHSSGKSSGRSASATQLILDEAEFIQNIEELQASSAMTLSATGGKAIILSTPWMHGSQFYNMVKGAKEGKNGFILIEGDQKKVPGRDEKQYREQCESLNQDKKKIKTELDMEQIIPYKTYFYEEVLENLKESEPIDYDGQLIIYEEYNPKNKYLLSVDTQEGGDDRNVILVMNINTKKIAALLVTTKDIHIDIVRISKKYNAPIAIERNRAYFILKYLDEIDMLNNVLPGIKYVKSKDEFIIDEKKGIYTSQFIREQYLILISSYIKKYNVLPKELIKELKAFVIKKNGKPEGLEHDDVIIALGINLFYQHFYTNKSINKDIQKEIEKVMNSNNKQIKRKDMEQQIYNSTLRDKSIKFVEPTVDLITLLESESMKEKNTSKYKYFFIQ